MFELERSAPGSGTRRSTPTRSASSLAAQALFAYAPDRSGRAACVSKLRQVPRLIQAARDNIKDCPGHLRQGGDRDAGAARSSSSRATCRGPSPALDDLHILGDLADASTEAVARRSTATSTTSKPTWRPGRKASFRLGREKFEQKLKLEEGITLSADRLLAIALRELQRDPGGVPARRRPPERRRSARRLAARQGEPSRPGPARRRRRSSRSTELAEFVAAAHARDAARRRSRSSSRPSPEFYRWSSASMWTPGPFETQAEPRVLLPHRRRPLLAAGSAERAPARLQLPDALDHLDARGVSRPLPALPAPAAGRLEGAQVDASSRRRPSSKAGRTTASR